MPYLPRIPLEDTEFPRAYGMDLAMQIRMIEEQYRRMYPVIEYYVLRKAVTPMQPDPHNLSGEPGEIVGEAGTTAFDPLWGESVPETERQTGWQQPQGNPTHQGQPVDIYDGPYELHARVQREAKEKELKHLGFDEMLDLLVYIPASILDAKGITVGQEDYFVWDGQEFVVRQMSKTGWWQNTNIRLYLALNCVSRKAGL